ncbi:hypothetical protein FKR81_02820 [Lentzea tibetensis]|uniref:ABM domain-containing protein n=1 Tax=Lentzea tibetensis TaxID=2591470 RepID=A0A563F143_9PSEU|nr:hypothetical protein [Lentzea tibetensis]TWP53706.1 hypothetical protein FKR81_02820 [Lentzea tibetensis]
MEWITIATPPFGELEKFDKMTSGVAAPEGLVARYAGTTADGELQVIALWQSKQHADAFFSRILGPALAAVLGPEPQGSPKVVGVDVARSYVA